MNSFNFRSTMKCDESHIKQSLKGYCTNNYGIFIKELTEWKFIPNEKSFSANNLLDIINTLNILNEAK